MLKFLIFISEGFDAFFTPVCSHPRRNLNQFTSQDVFLGPYLRDPVTRAKFSKGYRDMTDAFLAFPFCFPGTAVWRGRVGRLYCMTVLNQAAGQAKEKMKVRGQETGRGGGGALLHDHPQPGRRAG